MAHAGSSPAQRRAGIFSPLPNLACRNIVESSWPQLLLLPLLPLLSASDRSHCKSLRLAVHREQAENKLLGGTPLAGVWTLLHTGAVLTPE
jgi:hypothetical protein